MQIYRTSETELTLTLTEVQLSFLFGCVRESFASISREDYQLRVGLSLQEASDTAQELKALLEGEGIE